MRTNLFFIVLSLMFLTMGLSSAFSQELKRKNNPIPAKPYKIATSNQTKQSLKVTDTIKLDSVKKNQKVFLDGIVKYKAKDYVKINQKKKLITLYNQAELYYTDVELKSGIIVMNYAKNEVYAGRLKDSVGKYIQYPNFKQGTNVVEPDSIRFNFKTKKALVWNSRTEQGEFKVKAGISKRVNDSVYFMKGARFTTAKDIDDPEYWFYTNRLKFVPGKKIVTGLTNLVIAGVPTPLALPFAFFPMGKEVRNSGILIPTFADNAITGYSLINGGYYFALSDSYDLAVTGDYFTNGGYGLRLNSAYANRYKFSGNLNFTFQNLISGERGFSGYEKRNIYNIAWDHRKDAKSNPNSSFSASVRMGSTKFYQQSQNINDYKNRLTNNTSSSINYTKRFNCVPQVNLSLTVNQNQNSQDGKISLTLPTLQIGVDRVFPFAKKEGVKNGFIENINFQYTLTGKNQIETTDQFFLTSQMFKNSENGLQHEIPISTKIKAFKHFSVGFSTNYNEVWYTKTIRKGYDYANKDKITPTSKKEVIDVAVNGFDAYRTYGFRADIGTTIYGTFKFGDNKKIQAIQHVLTPNLSYSYLPSFDKYFENFIYKNEFDEIKTVNYSRFEKGIYGAPGKNYSNNINFSLGNTFEAKVRDKDSIKTEAKKVKLLNLNFTCSYDITRDSLRFSPVNMSGGTVLFNQKLTINFGANLDPYSVDVNGIRRNKFNITNHGSLFRLTNANVSMNYAISSKELRGEKPKIKKTTTAQNQFGNPNDVNNIQESLFTKEDEEEEVKKDKPKFYYSKIDWTLTFAYSFSYSNTKREEIFPTHSIAINATIDLTPKWKITGNTGYDINAKIITYPRLAIERDLLSWRMNFNWVPAGTYTSWGFFIGIKSSVLSDIKWEKNKVPDRRL